MAKGGAFNVAQLIRELGLQTISGETMRILETIQPVMAVGDLSDVTPPHVAPSALFGVQETGAVGTAAIIEAQCLAPGGLFIEMFSAISGFTTCSIRITEAAIGPGLPVLATAGQASREPIASVVRSGAVAQSPLEAFTITQVGEITVFGSNAIFVPRGRFFSMQATLDNTIINFGFWIREVPASEHVPA